MEKLIKRINELSAKSKNNTITDAERAEQAQLRKEYIEKFRESFKSHIGNIKVVNDDGEDITPQKIKDLKKEN